MGGILWNFLLGCHSIPFPPLHCPDEPCSCLHVRAIFCRQQPPSHKLLFVRSLDDTQTEYSINASERGAPTCVCVCKRGREKSSYFILAHCRRRRRWRQYSRLWSGLALSDPYACLIITYNASNWTNLVGHWSGERLRSAYSCRRV